MPPGCFCDQVGDIDLSTSPFEPQGNEVGVPKPLHDCIQHFLVFSVRALPP